MVGENIDAAIAFVRSLPQRAVAALAGINDVLVNAGRNLINGFIAGVRQAIPGLQSLLNFVTNNLPNWKGPEDKDKAILKPAGEAVMRGFGEGLSVGARDVQQMLGDFTSGLGGMALNANTNNISFGAGAVAVNFRGALPTSNEANATGMAVGAGINSQLAARNTRLAVRTL